MEKVDNEITRWCDKKGAVTYRDLTQSGMTRIAYDKLPKVGWVDTTELRKLEEQLALEERKADKKGVQ